ncbi:MAG: 50S ribosomal protein L25/general stress protein Ctc [Bacteroidales bacterium]|jgi:large subunit ribosomal protein L25|nr:50S ribosomal protein L25/general stress protein Ctc [Bacteroidales bacterium]MDD4213294.1 50S ribosomal protein L25/general stress protein Ctc [Bacteroidales bacterium]
MKVVSLSGSLRGNVGKKDARKIRNEGGVPCVVYGGKEQVHFFTEAKSFKNIVFTPDVCYVKLQLGDKELDAILQDIQYHPVTDNILHADFLELHPDRPILMNIPVIVTGTAAGVLKGGRMVQKYRRLKIKALPAHMPEKIEINITPFEIGQSVKIGDIPTENFMFTENKNNTVVAVTVTRVVEEVAPAAEAAAPGAPGTPAAAAPGAAAGAKAPAAEEKGKDKGKEKGKK